MHELIAAAANEKYGAELAVPGAIEDNKAKILE